MKIFKNKTHTGFSLIELVIIVVIIGILATVALPKFRNITTESHLNIAKRHAKQIIKAAMYRTTLEGQNSIVSLERLADGSFVNMHNLQDYHYALSTDIKIITIDNTRSLLNLDLSPNGRYRIFGYTHDADIDPGSDYHNTAIFAAPTGNFLAFANVPYDGDGNVNIALNNSTGGRLPGVVMTSVFSFAAPH